MACVRGASAAAHRHAPALAALAALARPACSPWRHSPSHSAPAQLRAQSTSAHAHAHAHAAPLAKGWVDLKALRQRKESAARDAALRGASGAVVEETLDHYDRYRAVQARVDAARAGRKALSKKIGQIKGKDRAGQATEAEVDAVMAESTAAKEGMAALEDELREVWGPHRALRTVRRVATPCAVL